MTGDEQTNYIERGRVRLATVAWMEYSIESKTKRGGKDASSLGYYRWRSAWRGVDGLVNLTFPEKRQKREEKLRADVACRLSYHVIAELTTPHQFAFMVVTRTLGIINNLIAIVGKLGSFWENVTFFYQDTHNFITFLHLLNVLYLFFKKKYQKISPFLTLFP